MEEYYRVEKRNEIPINSDLTTYNLTDAQEIIRNDKRDRL